tara:strand:- start:433 stop:696 length:264 start_codon:yes stop_codon:yes gene_type:complete
VKNPIEVAYDDVRYADKDMAQLPSRFYMLDDSMAKFLEEFVDMLDRPHNHDNIDDIAVAQELIAEAKEILNAVELRIKTKEGLNESK